MAEPDTGRTAPDQAAPSTGEQPVARSVDPAREDVAAREETTREDVAAREDAGAHGTTPVQRPAEPQPVMEPAVQDAPAAPKRRSNRLVGTAWVLLAAGLFQVVYFGAIAALVALLGGADVVGAQLAQYATTPFAWLPVLFFFLLFELTVLIFNRAGRFLYVVASLVVGVVVYVVSVLLITILVRGDVGDRATLEQSFLSPLFVLAGLAAREVMLWTGVAIGARGTRLRKRNRADRDSYRAELGERQHAG